MNYKDFIGKEINLEQLKNIFSSDEKFYLISSSCDDYKDGLNFAKYFNPKSSNCEGLIFIDQYQILDEYYQKYDKSNCVIKLNLSYSNVTIDNEFVEKNRERYYICEVTFPLDVKIYVNNYQMHADKLIFGEKKEFNFNEYIENKTLEFFLRAVKRNGNALQFLNMEKINRNSFSGISYTDICLAAVRENGESIQWINICEINQNIYKIYLEAVKQNGNVLFLIQEQTFELCLEAVKQNGNALQFVKEKFTDEQMLKLCSVAIDQTICSLPYIKKYSIEIALKIVKKYGGTLSWILEHYFTPEQIYILCLEAVKQDGTALYYINDKILLPEQYFKICLEAVRENGSSILYVKGELKNCENEYKYYELCLEAVKQCKYFLKYIDNVKIKNIILEQINC